MATGPYGWPGLTIDRYSRPSQRSAPIRLAADGPDILHYRSKSAFEAAPKLGIDGNAYARILHYLYLIERGTYEIRRYGH